MTQTMLRSLLLILALVAVAGCDSDPFDADGRPYAASDVDVQAMPIGGYGAIAALTEYPRLARDAGIAGRVVVRGVVVPGETLSDAVVETTPSDVLSSAALDAVRSRASGRVVAWTPARIGTREVAAETRFCVDFQLTGETDPSGSSVGQTDASACLD